MEMKTKWGPCIPSGLCCLLARIVSVFFVFALVFSSTGVFVSSSSASASSTTGSINLDSKLSDNSKLAVNFASANISTHNNLGGGRSLDAVHPDLVAPSGEEKQFIKSLKDAVPSDAVPTVAAKPAAQVQTKGAQKPENSNNDMLSKAPTSGGLSTKKNAENKGTSFATIEEGTLATEGVKSESAVRTEDGRPVTTPTAAEDGRVGVVHNQSHEGTDGSVQEKPQSSTIGTEEGRSYEGTNRKADALSAINDNIRRVTEAPLLSTGNSGLVLNDNLSNNNNIETNGKLASFSEVPKIGSSASFTDKSASLQFGGNDRNTKLPSISFQGSLKKEQPPLPAHSEASSPSLSHAPSSPASSKQTSIPLEELKGSPEGASFSEESASSDGFFSAFGRFIMERSVLLLKTAAVLSAIAMQITPISTVRLIARAQSTGDLDGLPYIMLMFSACLWMVYGILRLDTIIMLPNITGLMLGGWYVGTYHLYCNNSTYRRSLDGYYKVCGAVAVALFVILIIAGKSLGTIIVGLSAAFFNVISYASPLAGLRVVIRDKSTACMPAEVSIGNFVCSSLWLAYGCVVADLFVIIPNLLGAVVGSLQIGLLAAFPPPKSRGFDTLRSKAERLSTNDASYNSTYKDGAANTCAIVGGMGRGGVDTWMSNYSEYWNKVDDYVGEKNTYKIDESSSSAFLSEASTAYTGYLNSLSSPSSHDHPRASSPHSLPSTCGDNRASLSDASSYRESDSIKSNSATRIFEEEECEDLEDLASTYENSGNLLKYSV